MESFAFDNVSLREMFDYNISKTTESVVYSYYNKNYVLKGYKTFLNIGGKLMNRDNSFEFIPNETYTTDKPLTYEDVNKYTKNGYYISRSIEEAFWPFRYKFENINSLRFFLCESSGDMICEKEFCRSQNLKLIEEVKLTPFEQYFIFLQCLVNFNFTKIDKKLLTDDEYNELYSLLFKMLIKEHRFISRDDLTLLKTTLKKDDFLNLLNHHHFVEEFIEFTKNN